MNIFITGGSSGIGEALTLFYHQQGHTIGVCSHLEIEFKNSKIANLSKVYFYKCDVTNSENLAQAMENFAQKVGGLDLVYANAGISHQVKSGVPPLAESIRMININVIGVIHTFDAAIKIMQKQFLEQKKTGHIVAMSSNAALNGLPGRSTYCASKAAVLKWCESMQQDLAPFGIAVSCIVPGFINTPLTRINTHHMPLLMEVDDAVKKIVEGVAKKKFFIAFPWPTYLFSYLLSIIPRNLFVKIALLLKKVLQ